MRSVRSRLAIVACLLVAMLGLTACEVANSSLPATPVPIVLYDDEYQLRSYLYLNSLLQSCARLETLAEISGCIIDKPWGRGIDPAAEGHIRMRNPNFFDEFEMLFLESDLEAALNRVKRERDPFLLRLAVEDLVKTHVTYVRLTCIEAVKTNFLRPAACRGAP